MIALERILPRARIQYGSRKALYSRWGWLSFEQLADRAFRLAAALASKGISPGDRIAVLDNNSPEYVETYYAAVHIGAVLVPINSRLSERELEYILCDSAPRILIVGPNHLPQLEQLRSRNVAPQTVVVIGADVGGCISYEAEISGHAASEKSTPSKQDDIVAIYYTSGTTGEPKGVCLTHANMSASALDVIVGLSLGRDDVWLHAAPLFHLVDAWAVWALPLLGAAQATVHFTSEAFVAVCKNASITHAALPPTLISLLCEQPASSLSTMKSLKRIMYGGSPMPPSVLERAKGLIPAQLSNSYGATETSGTMTLVHESTSPARTAGKPVVSAIIDIVDGDGNTLPAGEAGEIVISGTRVMAGYWNKSAATKEAIVAGRYHTGDIGYLDSKGNLYMADRKKDMIITGGENVYSIEVEGVIAGHPAVLECAVIGVPHERWVEAVHAVAVTIDGAAVTPDELISFCRGKIAAYKIPKSIEILRAPLPRSATGKIQKHEIRARYLKGAKA
jgi:long-chain acyl-CoA synthetase